MADLELPAKRRRRKKFVKERPLRPDAVGSDWRLFIAVPLPEDVKALVSGLVRDLSTEPWPVRWVSPETSHITLHFLGDVSPERAELLRLALPGVVARHQRFRLRTADLGVFPNQRRPRVIWLGLYGPAHRLTTLHGAIGELLKEMDFPVEAGPLHPHVTLGRLRDVRNQPVRDLPARIVERFQAESAAGRASAANAIPVPIDEIILYRSHLSHEGSRYEEIVRCPLASPT